MSEAIELAGCVIRDEQGRILLLHRHKDAYDHWEIPGGKVEAGESAQTAAVREVQEETDVKVRAGKILGSKQFTDRGRDFNYTWFQAKVVGGQIKITEPEVFDNFKYFSEAEMTKLNLSLGAKAFLSLKEKAKLI